MIPYFFFIRSSFSSIGLHRINTVAIVDTASTALNGIPAAMTDSTDEASTALLIVNTVHRSSSGPVTSIINSPLNIVTGSFFSAVMIPLRASSPAMNPAIPYANICHGVQSPCPKIKLLTNAVSEPVMNPPPGPNAMPAMIIMPITGLT